MTNPLVSYYETNEGSLAHIQSLMKLDESRPSRTRDVTRIPLPVNQTCTDVEQYSWILEELDGPCIIASGEWFMVTFFGKVG